mgnify:CR=1 FL=1
MTTTETKEGHSKSQILEVRTIVVHHIFTDLLKLGKLHDRNEMVAGCIDWHKSVHHTMIVFRQYELDMSGMITKNNDVCCVEQLDIFKGILVWRPCKELLKLQERESNKSKIVRSIIVLHLLL